MTPTATASASETPSLTATLSPVSAPPPNVVTAKLSLAGGTASQATSPAMVSAVEDAVAAAVNAPGAQVTVTEVLNQGTGAAYYLQPDGSYAEEASGRRRLQASGNVWTFVVQVNLTNADTSALAPGSASSASALAGAVSSAVASAFSAPPGSAAYNATAGAVVESWASALGLPASEVAATLSVTVVAPTPTVTASPSPTSSVTAPSTASATMTPSASLVWRPWSGTLAVLRVGNASLQPSSVPPGTALPVYLDYLSVATGRVWLTVPLPPTAGSDALGVACTLAAGQEPRWDHNGEGIASLSTDGRLIVVPCYNAAVGTRISALGAGANKTILTINATGTVVGATTFAAYAGVVAHGVGTGFHAAATVDGAGFWVAGRAASGAGFRYVPAGRHSSSAGT
jgi:hypothetical protein